MSAAKTIKRVSALALASLCIFIPSAAQAEDDPVAKDGFGIAAFDGEIIANPEGAPYTQAGGHPYAASSTFRFNRYTHPVQGPNWPEEPVKDTIVELPPGLDGNAQATPKCTLDQLIVKGVFSNCPASTQVGLMTIFTNASGATAAQNNLFANLPVYNMIPPPGTPARFGVNVQGTYVPIDAQVRSESDYGITLVSKDISEGIPTNEVKVTFWGTPADPRHDALRLCPGGNLLDRGCSSNATPQPLINMPSACTKPGVGPITTLRADSWFHPGEFKEASFESHLPPNFTSDIGPEMLPPLPPDQWGEKQGPTGCEDILFEPQLHVAPTADASETPSGLSAELTMPTEGLTHAEILMQSAIKKAVVTLPEGISVNPSAGEGLGACTPAQLDKETYNSPLGAGCPAESKIGSVEIESPLAENKVEGSLFIAQQDDPATTTPGAENPFDSLLAVYLVAKSPREGLIVKLAGKVEPDEKTGQLKTTFGDPSAAQATFRQLPQLPFSSFRLKFREGQRGILVSPPTCGTYQTKAEFTPYSNPSQIKTVFSPFTLARGVGGGACATGARGFHPGLDAGTLNNAAARFSPFNIRLTRNDGEQEFTHFSIKLPPGITGKLAGIPFCSEQAIAVAKSREHTGGGGQELISPSCPTSSLVGRTLVGAGVGPALTYVPGKVYLAGPYNGSALSIVAITAAKVGPFDVGTVVVRQALKINPETAEVFIDATGSDPIPHIIDGIVVHARDIRAYVDRPDFVLNPTSCERTSTASTLLGSGADFVSTIDDNPITVTSPFQAADCGALPFKPRLSLSLKGGTKRGQNPAFKAILRMPPESANISRAQVTLPHSAFLDQSHIKTVCTRVQFKEGAFPGAMCPQGSIYGYAKAITPLLDEPIEGPVFLRSSSHPLPDLVAALHNGKIDINVIGRIDSVGDGQIRNTFESVPDAPVSTFTLTMQGAKKGLLINSANLCKTTNRASVRFSAHNGKTHNFKPLLKAQCAKAKKSKRQKKR